MKNNQECKRVNEDFYLGEDTQDQYFQPRENKKIKIIDNSFLGSASNNFCDDFRGFQTQNTQKSTFSEDNLPKNPLEKGNVIALFEGLFSQKISKKVLADIYLTQEGELHFTTLGRESVKGSSSKQMRHVTPYAFIENLIKSIITSKPSKETLISFKKVLKILIINKEGYCFSPEDLKKTGYDDLAIEVPKLATKTLQSESLNLLFVSPAKLRPTSNASFTPRKQEGAKKAYSEYYPKYAGLVIENLANLTKDSNTTTQITEALIRSLLGFYQKGEVAFPEEGNTQSFQIRLYQSKEDALNPKGKNYTLISAKDLQDLSKNQLISELIRLVDCEGPYVTKTLKCIKELSLIISNHLYSNTQIETQLKTYNNSNPITLILANNNTGVAQYNEKLTLQNYQTQIPYELAKLLYFVFDFKALEEVVLVGDRKGDITLYNSAKNKNLTKYNFYSGPDCREEDKNSAKGYNKKVKFRCEETDINFIKNKIVEHFVISTMPYLGFFNGFSMKDNFLNEALTALIKLVSIDYKLNSEEEGKLLVNAQEYYIALTNDEDDNINVDNSQLELNIPNYDFTDIFGSNKQKDEDSLKIQDIQIDNLITAHTREYSTTEFSSTVTLNGSDVDINDWFV